MHFACPAAAAAVVEVAPAKAESQQQLGAAKVPAAATGQQLATEQARTGAGGASGWRQSTQLFSYSLA